MANHIAENSENAWQHLPRVVNYDASSIDFPSVRFQLCTNIESAGLVEYLYMIVVYLHGESVPAMIVAAESCPGLQLERPSCYALGRFEQGGHSTLNISPDYGNPQLFLATALNVIHQSGLIPEAASL